MFYLWLSLLNKLQHVIFTLETFIISFIDQDTIYL